MDSEISPKNSEEEAGRPLDCAQAMEVVFARLLSDAVVAGWQEMEVALVLADIADDHVLRLKKGKSRKPD